jgi:glutaredoxin 3
MPPYHWLSAKFFGNDKRGFMQKIVIYTTATCPSCIGAKKLLDRKKLKYSEIAVDKDPAKREEMIELSGRRSVPQIFINDKPIGGFDDLSALDRSGKLDSLLLKNESNS